MTGLQRIYGRIAMMVGMLGVVLTPVCIVGVWRAENRLVDRTTDVVKLTRNAKDFVDGRMDQVRDVLRVTDEKVRQIGAESEKMTDEAEKNKPIVTTLKTLDADVKGHLEQALDLISSIQANLRSISNALILFDSLPSLSLSEKPARKDEGGLKEMSQSLTETADLLGKLLEHVDRIHQDGKVTEEERKQLRVLVSQLREKARQANGWLVKLRDQADDTEKQLLALELKMIYWTRVLAFIFTVLLICFCFSQVHLIRHGRLLADAGISPRIQAP